MDKEPTCGECKHWEDAHVDDERPRFRWCARRHNPFRLIIMEESLACPAFERRKENDDD